MIRSKDLGVIALTLASLSFVCPALAAPGAKGKGKPGKSSDDFPVVEAGQSCEAAIQSYVDDYDKKKKGDPPDLTASDFGAILNRGDYLGPCDVPPDMALDLCVAVQNGRAVGITVKTTPESGEVAKCVTGQLAGLEFPSAPRMDVAKTHFAPEKPEHENPSGGNEPSAPAPAAAPPPVPPSTGCGCGSSGSGGHASIIAGLALLALLPLRRGSRAL